MFKTLPEWIYFNSKTYYLEEGIMSEPVEGWTYFIYAIDKSAMPPEVTDGRGHYFLCTCDPSREVAYNDMLNRLNNMKPWLSLFK